MSEAEDGEKCGLSRTSTHTLVKYDALNHKQFVLYQARIRSESTPLVSSYGIFSILNRGPRAMLRTQYYENAPGVVSVPRGIFTLKTAVSQHTEKLFRSLTSRLHQTDRNFFENSPDHEFGVHMTNRRVIVTPIDLGFSPPISETPHPGAGVSCKRVSPRINPIAPYVACKKYSSSDKKVLMGLHTEFPARSERSATLHSKFPQVLEPADSSVVPL